MNILVFSWRDTKHPFAGGAEQVDHEHHKGWIKAGHSVTLFTSMFPEGKKFELVDGVSVIRSGSQILGVQLKALIWYLFSKHENFDLVIDEFHGIPFFTPLYVRKPKISVLQEVAREVWLKNDLHFPLNIIIGYIGYFFEPLFFIFYKKISFIVGSNSAKIELAKVGVPVKNIQIIPHGVILELPKKLPEKEKIKTIVFLGALAKDKGIEDAIETFKILNEKGNFNFWVIGKGGPDYVNFLKNKCKEFNISEKVKFWGFVTQKDKFRLLSRAHIMINPSLLEGFGLVNIEANSVGTPVIAYNSPGLTDSVKEKVSGILCKQNKPQELARNIIEILHNKKEYSTLSKTSIEWSKKFNWDTSRKLSLALIEKIGLQ